MCFLRTFFILLKADQAPAREACIHLRIQCAHIEHLVCARHWQWKSDMPSALQELGICWGRRVCKLIFAEGWDKRNERNWLSSRESLRSAQMQYRYRDFQQMQAMLVQEAVLRCPSKVTARPMMPTDPKLQIKPLCEWAGFKDKPWYANSID